MTGPADLRTVALRSPGNRKGHGAIGIIQSEATTLQTRNPNPNPNPGVYVCGPVSPGPPLLCLAFEGHPTPGPHRTHRLSKLSMEKDEQSKTYLTPTEPCRHGVPDRNLRSVSEKRKNVDWEDTCTTTERLMDACTTTERLVDTCTTTERLVDAFTTTERLMDTCTTTERLMDTCTTTERLMDACTTTERLVDVCNTTERLVDVCTTTERIMDSCSTTERLMDTCTTTECTHGYLHYY
ncbi:hypothetical protein P4O66_001570 [Electrophorus voltai]|uniref:Uncharacterized protein n=1 Tax=Electrophorus voltai TaxID=2609070 RepID=A0AAD9DUP1_9TELE|nr:hypothetical protein P4O66_001570 [Electrophorus voltai]